MGNEKKPETLTSTYTGTVKVQIRGKDYFVHISTPPMGASLEELEKALQLNRATLDRCQQQMKEAYVEQTFKYKPPMLVNYDSPTQEAIMAHMNINVLIPLINIRGGQASFTKAETFHVTQRVEIMRNAAERAAQIERYQGTPPLPIAIVTVLILSTVMFALFIGK